MPVLPRTSSMSPGRPISPPSDARPRERHLRDAGIRYAGELGHDRFDGDRGFGAARLPHDAVGAPVVAAVLDLDPQPRAAGEAREPMGAGLPRLRRGGEAQPRARGPRDTRFPRYGAHTAREGLDGLAVQVDGAPGGDDEGQARQGGGVPHGLAGLGLGLAGDGAGVDHDDVRLALVVHELEALGGELPGNRVALDAVDAAAQVDDGGAGGARGDVSHARRASRRWPRGCGRPPSPSSCRPRRPSRRRAPPGALGRAR